MNSLVPLQRATEGSPSLDLLGISSQLRSLNYPEKALINFERCGQDSNNFIMATCGCGTYPIKLKYNCGQSFCPRCSKIRKKRLRRRLIPYVSQFPNTNTYKWRFLTISPKSYKNYDEGKKHVKDSWRKFLRVAYSKKKNEKGRWVIDEHILDRIKGGFSLVEVTNKNGLWHFHIHAIIYSKHLDNVYRGKCSSCGQSYLKRDRFTKKFYCANRNCNQIYSGVIESPKVARLFSQCSGRACFSDISQARSSSRVLNYMLKYLTLDKDSFSKKEDYYFHISKSYHDRPINSFGSFYGFKKQIEKDHKMQLIYRCPVCFERLTFSYDSEVNFILNNPPPPPPPYQQQQMLSPGTA